MIDKNCINCGKKMEGKYLSNRKYCNRRCIREKRRKEFYECNPKPICSSGTTGAISELKISIDLLSKGYDVFRALSQSCSCDLALLANDQLYKIEVTTAYMAPTGHIYHTKKKNGRFDILAIVTKCGKIFYEPNLPELNKE